MSIPITEKNIYQYIWNADQVGNGVRPVLSSDDLTDDDKENGYVIVDWPTQNTKDHRVLAEAKIPDKGGTYKKCRALFDNYELVSSDKEVETSQETDEIKDFIDSIKDTLPMKIARDYFDANLSDDEWFDMIRELWFTPFGDKYRSGFEHVFVGENSGSSTNIGGYHFWYKYYVDDGDGQVNGKDTIDFGNPNFGTNLNGTGREVPEIVTLKFDWDPDENERGDSLEKPRGGFWVGCSPEGLFALGIARWKQKTESKIDAVINETRFEIRLATDVDDKHVNTFYPVFKRSNVSAVEVPELPLILNPPPSVFPRSPTLMMEGGPSPVRIIAALVNPTGLTDTLRGETVSIINVINEDVNLDGWTISNSDGVSGTFGGFTEPLGPGECRSFPTSRVFQLDNNTGDDIFLKDSSGQIVDHVRYSGGVGSEEGKPIFFQKNYRCNFKLARGNKEIHILILQKRTLKVMKRTIFFYSLTNHAVCGLDLLLICNCQLY